MTTLLRPYRPLDIDEIVTASGPQRRATGRMTKIRFVDKLIAIDRAMKHIGLFERDNRQRDNNIDPGQPRLVASDAGRQ
jgi:hypothetical protein